MPKKNPRRVIHVPAWVADFLNSEDRSTILIPLIAACLVLAVILSNKWIVIRIILVVAALAALILELGDFGLTPEHKKTQHNPEPNN